MPLSRRTSLEAQRVMREAFMDLERVITVADRAQLKNLTLDDVRQAALQIEQQLAASQSLRNMRRLAPLFTGLGHYSQAIEVLCNGTPYLPWIWAPIKLVLKISADYIEAFEQIIKIYSRLSEPLTRFSFVQQPFSNNLEVQNALAVYYSDILRFHAEAYNFVRRNAWQRLFATSRGRFQRRFDHIFADLKEHGDLIDKLVNVVNICEAKDMRLKVEDWRQQEMSKLKKEEEDRTSTEFHAILSVLRVDETHQIKVFDSLTAEANQNPGSCGWILQQPKIQAWARADHNTQSVVLHGCVGSGKSVLAAQIGTFLRSSEQSLVAAHFCTYLYPESTDYNHMMRSLMVQIIRQDPELIALSYDRLVIQKKPPTCAVIEQLLRLLVEALATSPSQQKTLHIVFDGLDECDDSTVSNIVKTFDKLVATASTSGATILKVLLCTQMTPAVAKVVKRKRQVSLSDETAHLNRAIQDYTLRRINAIRPNLSQLRITEEDIQSLASHITEKADGMFLWAKLVMEFISKNFFYNREEILEAASKLPRELGKFYGRILAQIMANFDERSVQRISSVLSWISFAKRPLRSPELLSALAFDAGHAQVNEPVPAYILDRCEPLIQKQADSSYAFLHVSVRDFLQSTDSALSITIHHSQRQHGLATVHCLLSCQQIFAPPYPETQRVGRILRGTHGFHIYATQFWVDYLLESLNFDQSRFFDSEIFVLSCCLAEAFPSSRPSPSGLGDDELDPRLGLIRQRHYSLYLMAKGVILEQNKSSLEDVSNNEADALHNDINHHAEACDLIALKEKYQVMIRELLNYSTYPGVTFQELEQFKQYFRTSAFTCRLWSCPYAVIGFSTMDGLTQHEKEHAKHVCRFAGCQYPVFTSARMLKMHVAKYHANNERREARPTIRGHSKRRTSPSQRESRSADTNEIVTNLSARNQSVDSQGFVQSGSPSEASPWIPVRPMDGIPLPSSPALRTCYSFSDTIKQPASEHNIDTIAPDKRLDHLSALDASRLQSAVLSMPSDKEEAFPAPRPVPRNFGLAEESFQPNNAAVARIKMEANAAPSGQAATLLPPLSLPRVEPPPLPQGSNDLLINFRREYPDSEILCYMTVDTASGPEKLDWQPRFYCGDCAYSLAFRGSNFRTFREQFEEHLKSHSHRENVRWKAALRRLNVQSLLNDC
ncbi:hypothetical protein V8C44DRAFT_325861 [Trichoderma aethiopicum]